MATGDEAIEAVRWHREELHDAMIELEAAAAPAARDQRTTRADKDGE